MGPRATFKRCTKTKTPNIWGVRGLVRGLSARWIQDLLVVRNRDGRPQEDPLVGHLGGLYSRSRYLSSSAAVYSHFKTSVFNARPAVNCSRTAASPATSAAVSVHQGSDLSPTNEFICDPEIGRVDGSVQPTNQPTNHNQPTIVFAY